ncbi:flagellar hook-length control protein FliK [Rugamonas apoptosis]|uniref:Flagellar hook-length control protein FliK n=1 Tax=Rugamonas apoptosis TaxID=2758570 RepID=A0A7W2FBT6_9BURK|nr:flagellar hook-length control protein FliK [Rugamonas apoptosis]MBA5688821.1 flagellar hook-length control protein FliK [Rugamonas apoptosis]
MTLMTSTAPAASATSAVPAPLAAAADGAAPATSTTSAAPAAGAVASALPLFAQLLNLTDAAPAPAANEDGTPAPTTTDDTKTCPPGADPTAAMASMAATMLAVALPPPAQANLAAGGAGTAAPRIDALNTSAALNGAGARLDLSAVGVAVNAAPAPAAAIAPPAPAAAPAAAIPSTTATPAAAAPVSATTTGDAAPAAAQTVVAGQRRTTVGSERPAAAAQAAVAPASQPPAAAPVIPAAAQAVPAFASQPAPVPGVRAGERATRTVSAASAAATEPAPAMPLAASAKDDGAPAVTRAEPASAPVNGSYAQSAPATVSGDSVKLAGTPEQWQQPLREALGERLQVQLQRNDEHAVIRLEPPNMGRVEISIRHSGGALQVNLSANNSEVLRQLNSIGDSVRQDLSQRQFAEVAVTVSAAPRGMLAGGDGNGRGQQGQQEEPRTPGRALSDDSDAATSFAMSTERE